MLQTETKMEESKVIEYIISIVNLNKKYFEGKLAEVHALKDISLDIQKGEFVAIMGPSGSGKSSLLNILGCMAKATAGTVILDGITITNVPQSKLSSVRKNKLGFVFQDIYLLDSLNAIDNVLVPLVPYKITKEDHQRAESLLKVAGLGDRIAHKPGELSGGQKQRVAICRALINQPNIILADEPTGNLDSETGKEILSLLQEINETRGTTIIVVTHDTKVKAFASRIIQLEDGKIVKDFHQ